MPADGAVRPGNLLDMESNRIVDLADGVDPQDAVTVAQLAAAGGGGGGVVSGYSQQDFEKTGAHVYVGYEHSDGDWFIYRRTIASNVREYATGASGYTTAWTGRAGLSYA